MNVAKLLCAMQMNGNRLLVEWDDGLILKMITIPRLYPWYMETIWWVFQQLFEKGLVYQGVKVMPYSTACTTALSNFESGQNYKEVVDPCVVVALEMIGAKDKPNFLIWTTTTWTLPSNLVICVNPNMMYVKVKDLKTAKVVLLAECRLEHTFKTTKDYEILDRFEGKTLAGLKYKPLFPYFEELGETMNAFRVLVDDYVTEDSGTGIFQQAHILVRTIFVFA